MKGLLKKMPLLGVFFGGTSLIMYLSLPAVSVSSIGVDHLSGQTVIFGYGALIDLSVGALIGYILMIIGIFASGIAAMEAGKDNLFVKILKIVAAVAFLVGGVFMFLSAVLVAGVENATIAAGPIVCGILAILGSMGFCANILLKQ
ncbi:hypothetical protein LJC17_01350 [Acholeplasma sp. OttesenSCG-928-E16]|nr:hypothetical protein [Acholeplasma sp. OttesenSCG-928-E16]